MADGFVDFIRHFVHSQVRDRTVQRRCADERVNAAGPCLFDGFGAAVDIFEIGAGQTTDRRIFRTLGNFGYGAEITFGGDRETCFDDVDAHVVQHLCDFQFFVVGHCCAWRLFAVTQGCVENQHAVFGHVCIPCLFLALPDARTPLSGRAGRHAQRLLRSRRPREGTARQLPATMVICVKRVMASDYTHDSPEGKAELTRFG